VYVASKFENTKAVREAYEALKKDNHTITHDWTGENADGLHGAALDLYLRECAERDVAGVANCQGLLLINHELGCGMFTELGIAIALKKFIVVLDGKHPNKPRNIFFNLPDVHHAQSLEQARTLFNVRQMWLDEMTGES
jgi:hypothetical protein